MNRIVRLLLSCCLGLLVPAIIFPWLLQSLVPVKKKVVPSASFIPVTDTIPKSTLQVPSLPKKPKLLSTN